MKHKSLLLLMVGLYAGFLKAQVSLTTLGTPVVVDFTGFAGTGFQATPTTGQLDSDDWSLNSGTVSFAFGGSGTAAPWITGNTAGGVSGGGVYSLTYASTNKAIWIQPTGSNFTTTPGTMTLRIVNNTGAAMTALDLSYDIMYRDDINTRATTMNFSYSDNNTTYTALTAQNFSTAGATAVTTIQTTNKAFSLTGLNVANGGFFYLRWTVGDVAGGSGSRDEIGLDNISMTVPSAPATAVNFAVAASSVSESVGNASVTVSISASATCSVEVALTGGTATNGSDYTLTSPVTVNFTAGGATSQTVLIPITDDATPEGVETITLQLQNAVGCNMGSSNQHTMTINANDWPVVSNLVITEIMYNSPEAGTDSLEFIEVYNNGSTTADLFGTSFFGVNYTFPSGTTLAPGAYIVTCVKSSAYTAIYGGSAAQWLTGSALTNTGEVIRLIDGYGNVLDEVNYSSLAPWPTLPNAAGPSLVLCDPNSDNSLAANWRSSTTPRGVSINAISLYASPGVADNCSVAANFSASAVTVSEGVGTVTVTVSLSAPTDCSIDVAATAGTATSGSDYTFTSPTTLTFTSTGALSQTVTLTIIDDAIFEPNETIVLSLQNGVGCVAAPPSIHTITISANDYVPTTDLVFTEIMYNSPESGNDSLEYVEIYNKGVGSIDMTGYSIFGVSYTFPSYTLNAGAYVTVAVNSGAFYRNYGGTALQWTTNQVLTNNGETIKLLDNFGFTIDSVTYDDIAPWPSAANGNGYSLVLCDPTQPNHTYANWRIATTSVGTTINGFPLKANPNTGDMGIACAAPANDVCSAAIPVTCSGSPYNGITMGATVDVFPACGTNSTASNGVWYVYTGDNKLVTASLCGSGFDTYLYVFEGTCGALNCVFANDNNAACAGGGNTSLVNFNAQSGYTYYILVAGSNGHTGNFTLSLNCQTPVVNDAICGALFMPFPTNQQAGFGTYNLLSTSKTCNSIIGNTANATVKATLPATSCGTNGKGLWYKFTTPACVASGVSPFAIQVSTSNSSTNFDTKVRVFSSSDNTCNGTLTEVGCDNDGGDPTLGCEGGLSNSSLYNFSAAVSGSTYFVYVDGNSASAGGDFELSLFVDVPAPTLTVNAATPDKMDISTVVSTPNTYTYYWRPQGSAGYSVDNKTVNTYTTPLLAAGVTYDVQVMHRCASASSQLFRSNVASLLIPPYTNCASTTVSCGTSTSNSITVSWTEQTGAYTAGGALSGYLVYYRAQGTTGYSVWSNPAVTCSGGTCSYTITSLAPGVTYEIWVLTRCSATATVKSNTVACSTTSLVPMMVANSEENPNDVFTFEHNGIEYHDVKFDELALYGLNLPVPNENVNVNYSIVDGKLVQSSFTGSSLLDSQSFDFVLMPNPTSDQTTVLISAENVQSEAIISVVDALGRIISTQNVSLMTNGTNVSLETSHLANGVYNVCVKTNSQVVSKKLVVQH